MENYKKIIKKQKKILNFIFKFNFKKRKIKNNNLNK